MNTLWQPMETAPKDGTVILVLLTRSDTPYPVRWWSDYKSEGFGKWRMTWDHYILGVLDGPRYWMHCPDDPDEGGGYAGLTQATLDVLAERRRQVQEEGWTLEHDDDHFAGELAMAAACYAGSAGGYVWVEGKPSEAVWPWSQERWKPTTPRRDLIKAAALILAEIERLDRAETLDTNSGEPK